jgi:hypothetical protein
MNHKMNNFWWNYGDAISFITSAVIITVVLFGGAGLLITYGMAKQDQYNCELDRRPSLSTTFWINHNTYAYDPNGFCNKLKEKMAQE